MTKDKSPISTKPDIVNNTDKQKLLDLLDERTEIMKDNPTWQTMSISADIDQILLLNVILQDKQQKNISTIIKKTAIIRVMNIEHKNLI